jgi:leader peptidase (prepilin peptidase)/N-methyltransferase
LNTFNPDIWAAVPFHFWSGVFFIFGTMVGSFLNVCIHRMPIGESIVTPPSHCPHCRYSIPFYLNIPLVTWIYLRGKCANCRAPISARYFLVELLTGVIFLAAWLAFGRSSALLALAYCVILSGFIAATFIDFAHFIIPDEITLGGIVVGFLCSLAVPALHGVSERATALRYSMVGIAIGGGVIYGILRLGKLLFGRQKFSLDPNSRLVFTESALLLPDRQIPYEDIFYRKSDTIRITATEVEMIDRCYRNVPVSLTQTVLTVGEDIFQPETIPHLEVVTSELTIPREAMGLGDVKFMAAIGAFIGGSGVFFALMLSAIIGSVVGVGAIIIGRKEWSSRIPYGPYIAVAATIWIFLPYAYQIEWQTYLLFFPQILSGRPPG